MLGEVGRNEGGNFSWQWDVLGLSDNHLEQGHLHWGQEGQLPPQPSSMGGRSGKNCPSCSTLSISYLLEGHFRVL